MKKTSVETAVGVFVLIGLICVAYLTVKLGKMEWFGDNYYTVKARFDSVSGLKDGAQVDMAGVQIGQVADIHLDKKRQMAIVNLKIRKDIELNDDVIASVKTAGLIGDKYISLTPGASGRILKPGGTIIDTESAVDIEELISKYVFGSAKK
jgi:phospholipid/cholesterol/gamma-HCH transport system substrate-binding protein